ncbi:MAG: glucokinase [Desulfovibrio sp.]|nr:glucokinase [Desulfovibrio sp.]
MQHIFAADIGGTNARFARFACKNGRMSLETVKWSTTSSLANADHMVETMSTLLGIGPAAGDALAVALAGSVHGLTGHLTNGNLQLDLSHAVEHYGFCRCVLVNDFVAEAYATLSEVGGHARHLYGPKEPSYATAPRAVLGAGTGLGAASLHWSNAPYDGFSGGSGQGNGRWVAVPSEAGHVPFPFDAGEEQEYQQELSRTLNRKCVSAEDVLSGRGLVRLHAFLTGRQEDAAIVGQEALSHSTKTLQWYARFWGRFCRSWIYTTLCTGGLWIAGGIAARNPLCVTCSEFASELTRDMTLPDLYTHVPIWLSATTESGLWGAAYAVQEDMFRYAV